MRIIFVCYMMNLCSHYGQVLDDLLLALLDGFATAMHTLRSGDGTPNTFFICPDQVHLLLIEQ